MAKVKVTYERKRDRGEVKYVGAEIDPKLVIAIDRYIELHGSTKRFLIESGLKMFLESRDMWPLKDSNK